MMKWWGWGDPKITFLIHEKPLLWPWIKKNLHLDHVHKTTLPVTYESLHLPPSNIHKQFFKDISNILTEDQILTDKEERILHSNGKSYPNLFCIRKGILKRAPDIVLLPKSHHDVEQIVAIANQHNVIIIPFGGGTNIVGSIDPYNPHQAQNLSNCIVALDMRKMNNILEIDPQSHMAKIQAGILGPKLEADLQTFGWSLGHYPDSFEYSTLGGWLATRSAGMQSDAYGKIEDMLVSLKMVTPTGTLVTKTAPTQSSGSNMNHVVLGSEGIFGVITEATMRIHRIPEHKQYTGFLFHSFEDGVSAIQECLANNYVPSMIRFQDAAETELAFQMKSPSSGLKKFLHKQIKHILKWKGFEKPCIMVIGFEGKAKQIRHTAQAVYTIFKKYGAFSLGQSIGNSWSKDKFNMPYLRDFIMDYGVMVDVAETAVIWSKLLTVYHKTVSLIKHLFKENGDGSGFVGCHISHTYKTGACLYFTYATKQIPNKELQQYYLYKKQITKNFLEHGATLTHHHAVGYEHAFGLEHEISKTGVQTIHAIKNSLDPKNIMNPNKLLPINSEQKSDFFCINASQSIHNIHNPI